MNKAITEGLDLLPPDFVDGLSVWSSEDGTPGTITYQTNPAGTLVASDPDFGDCLELVTAQSPQRLRYMGETPILPGCYIEVSARVKLVSVTTGIPQVRIATFAGDANGNIVGPVPKTTPLVLLDAFNKVFTIKAIIGSGARTGVDLVWGTEPVYAHVGIDVQGDLGAVVRVESIKVEDKTSIFHRKLMDWVDVLDYGAIGDGVTNDSNAFETADAIAEGRTVIVPAGTYFLDRNVTMLSPVRIEGTITQPANRRLILRSNFDLPTYAAAFGDETLGLKKGIQALFNFADHSTFDLGGRQVDLSEPIDVFSVVGNISSITERRVLSNGLLTAENSNAWDTTTVNASASYSPSDPLVLKNVQNIGTIAVGSLVEGFGVGREVYVREVRTATEEITLSQPLNRAAPNQSYTFKRFKYMLDFSGFERVSSFTLDGVQLDGGRVASGVLLPDDGIWWIFRNCWFTRTGERGISSPGDACQGITIDQCEFLAADAAELVQNRTSVGFNVNKNDAKIRHCRGINLKHFGVLSGNGNLILGNHFWQLDDADPGERTAGLILTDRQSKTTITGNYIDTMFIEFTNEHAPDATDTSNIAFGQVSIVGNIFTATQVADWYKFIVWAPMGNNHRLEGINVMGNTFQLFGGSVIDRVDDVDTSLGNFNYAETIDFVWEGNSYGNVRISTASPALLEVTRSSASNNWAADASEKMPLGCHALGVDNVTAHGPLRNGSGGVVYETPYVTPAQGPTNQRVDVRWSTAVEGTVQLKIRADRPV